MPRELPAESGNGIWELKLETMKITCWNVNSVKTLRQYHPWSSKKSFSEILSALDAEIICLQETKLSREKVELEYAIPTNFDAYFSFCSVRKGYSGVVTYVKSTSSLPTMAAYDGFSELGFPIKCCSQEELKSFDMEGRIVITDHSLFVLINVYCPNETSQERLPYKMKFYEALEEVTFHFKSQKRSVIIAGDINACRAEIDHCDPQKSNKDYGLTDFNLHPARKWLNEFVDETNGKVIDLYRHFNPEKTAAYTCWNTLLNARPANYGTRIDYILITPDLLDKIEQCTIDSEVMGSDHCPVSVTIKLHNIGPTIQNVPLPKLCAKFYPEFTLKQKSLLSYFPSIQSKSKQNPKSQPTKKNETTNNDSQSQQEIIVPEDAPLCKHQEKCRLLVVNKNTPNKGRQFYICARPVGAGYEENKLTEFRCNFFKWKEEKSSKRKLKTEADSSSNVKRRAAA